MSQTSQCPECEGSLRIPEEKIGAVVKCPKCGAKFRAGEFSADSDLERGSRSGTRRQLDQIRDDDDFQTMPGRSRKSAKKTSAAAGSLQLFLRRWLTACGIVLLMTILIGLGGFFSEGMALAACFICIAAILGCLFAGTIWTAIDVARENILLGVAIILMPAIGPAIAYLKGGPARRGAIVFASLFAPTLLLGLLLLLLYPKYSGPGRQAAQQASWEALLQQLDDKVQPETPIVTSTLTVAARPGSLDGIEPQCEALLTPHKSYVAGSLKIDAANRTITYQYRGSKNFNMLIAFFLSNATGAFIPQVSVEQPGT